MTCQVCGMTIGWDCECDEELNVLIAEAAAQEQRAAFTTQRERSGDDTIEADDFAPEALRAEEPPQ